MRESVNIPYVKQTNLLGQVINPITKGNPFLTIGQNRKARRQKVDRALNNRGNCTIALFGRYAFRVRIQSITTIETNQFGKRFENTKQVLHYIPKKVN